MKTSQLFSVGVPALWASALVALALGCSDVGDSTAIAPPASDDGGATADVTVAEVDASNAPDGGAGDSGALLDGTAAPNVDSSAVTATDGGDASVDGGPDATVDATVIDGAPGNDATVDATIDAAEAADAASDAIADAAEEEASVAPTDGGCASNDYLCQCNAFIAVSEVGVTASTTCSRTEALLFQKDTTGGCLDCALQQSCIDDTGPFDVSQECDDLASSSTDPVILTPGPTDVAECLATLSCEIGVSPAASPSPLNIGPTAGTRTLGNAYCGAATSTACAGGSPKGACVTPIAAGLAPSFAAGSQTSSNLSNLLYPTGQAGAIVACLLAPVQCVTCVQ
jgi:hypothetical protein